MNRGEEKVRVHMNVVPRSTMNTNRELTSLMTSMVHFRFIPTSSLGFQVTLNLGETAPSKKMVNANMLLKLC